MWMISDHMNDALAHSPGSTGNNNLDHALPS
jgi:hypothetical protein